MNTDGKMIMSATREGVQASALEAEVSGEVLSSLINMAGRQRMLSQRIVLQAMLALQRFDNALAVARDTLRIFSESHATLLQGRNGLPGLFSPAIRDAFYGSGNVATRITAFISCASIALDAIQSQSARAEAAVHELIGRISFIR